MKLWHELQTGTHMNMKIEQLNVPCLESLIQGVSVSISLHQDLARIHMLYCQDKPANVITADEAAP